MTQPTWSATVGYVLFASKSWFLRRILRFTAGHSRCWSRSC